MPTTPTKVVIHPIVLLSTVDHYNRVAKDTQKRVVGILLGSSYKGVVDVTNSYAVPFDEDLRNPKIWFLDHNYHEQMCSMFKKINARETVVGWYSTGPNIKPNDVEIHQILRKYTLSPLLVIIDAQLQEEQTSLPTKAYISVEEVKEDGTTASTFQHIDSSIGALEAEEVGVEHLLRDIKDTTVSTLAERVNEKLLALKGLHSRLQDILSYVEDVCDGKLPLNQQILSNLQDIFNLMPNLRVEDLVKAFAVKSNDQLLMIYLSSLNRSVIALHNLINNKLRNRAAERKADDQEFARAKRLEQKRNEEDNQNEEQGKPETES